MRTQNPQVKLITDRKAYTSPRLKEFGPVGKLTQGGFTGDAEMGMSMSTQMQMT